MRWGGFGWRGWRRTVNYVFVWDLFVGGLRRDVGYGVRGMNLEFRVVFWIRGIFGGF